MSAQRVLITGGSQGIGAALVGRMRDAGDAVVFTGRHEERIAAVAQGSGAFGLRADVSVGDDNARVVDICRERMGGIDILVNNAAFPYSAEIGDFDVDRMRELFATNVFGVVDLTNRIVPMMKAQQSGDIVNIASTSGMKGHKAGTAYAGSKWALRGISQCWQAEPSAAWHPRHQPMPVGGSDRLGGQGWPEQRKQAVCGRHRRDDRGGAQHEAPHAVARARGVRHEPMERGLSLARRCLLAVAIAVAVIAAVPPSVVWAQSPSERHVVVLRVAEHDDRPSVASEAIAFWNRVLAGAAARNTAGRDDADRDVPERTYSRELHAGAVAAGWSTLSGRRGPEEPRDLEGWVPTSSSSCRGSRPCRLRGRFASRPASSSRSRRRR